MNWTGSPFNAPFVLPVLAGSVAVDEAEELEAVPVPLLCVLAVDEAEEGYEVAGDPLLAFAFSWKAAAVWSPERGGFTARTMPDLQSEFAAEKNQSGLVSLTFPCHARSSAVVELGYNEAVTHSKIIGVPGVAID